MLDGKKWARRKWAGSCFPLFSCRATPLPSASPAAILCDGDGQEDPTARLRVVSQRVATGPMVPAASPSPSCSIPTGTHLGNLSGAGLRPACASGTNIIRRNLTDVLHLWPR